MTQDTDQPTETAREADILSGVSLFAGLARDSIRSIQAFAFHRTFEADDVIVEEGRTGNGLYVVLSGRVEVVRSAGSPRERVLATLGPGEPFGELALLGEWKRTATVRAVETTACLGIDRWVFLAHLKREPELAIRMLQVVAQRLVETDAALTLA